MSEPWPFDDPPNVATITTRFVLDRSRPILLVTHDEDDGSWTVLCGTTDITADFRVIGLGEALVIDDTLGELADLPLGWIAWRTARDKPWIRELSHRDEGTETTAPTE